MHNIRASTEIMENNLTDSAAYAMMAQMKDEKEDVVRLCKKEIHKTLCLGLDICNMTSKSKITKRRMLCLEPNQKESMLDIGLLRHQDKTSYVALPAPELPWF